MCMLEMRELDELTQKPRVMVCSRGTALAPFPVCATEISNPVPKDFGKHVLPCEVYVLQLFRAAEGRGEGVHEHCPGCP